VLVDEEEGWWLQEAGVTWIADWGIGGTVSMRSWLEVRSTIF